MLLNAPTEICHDVCLLSRHSKHMEDFAITDMYRPYRVVPIPESPQKGALDFPFKGNLRMQRESQMLPDRLGSKVSHALQPRRIKTLQIATVYMTKYFHAPCWPGSFVGKARKCGHILPCMEFVLIILHIGNPSVTV